MDSAYILSELEFFQCKSEISINKNLKTPLKEKSVESKFPAWRRRYFILYTRPRSCRDSIKHKPYNMIHVPYSRALAELDGEIGVLGSHWNLKSTQRL
jgi:hypothetical protein